MCWCESFAGVGVKYIDTLGYEPPKSSERSRPQEMAELMGLSERFGGAARRHTVTVYLTEPHLPEDRAAARSFYGFSFR